MVVSIDSTMLSNSVLVRKSDQSQMNTSILLKWGKKSHKNRLHLSWEEV